METFIVGGIVIVAAIYVARIFYRGFIRKENCACGCSGCSLADSCDPPLPGDTPSNRSAD
ncbi:FeoB-associated Cys-rich membrane protein [Desulfosarcina ovata]|uniref:FeoB-associated Cys-rich membrane protein n=1 Tax=Desulfosarcina ovata subsp. ovata TaxID=2752305 RepID=A0A5K8AKR9_9BACT|nr:FeoB-associated Cys-rich membrane protein [Desulfosarcina ovata]BBO93312.1 hypothetical protein DSCOOX_64920 [Desulfosarcina ovata subsp. ovata]